MGRKPDPRLAELKATLRHYLDEAVATPHGLVIHADAHERVLRITKQVKKEHPRWNCIAVRPGDLNEIHLIKKD